MDFYIDSNQNPTKLIPRKEVVISLPLSQLVSVLSKEHPFLPIKMFSESTPPLSTVSESSHSHNIKHLTITSLSLTFYLKAIIFLAVYI
jgi:hypothetical protein